MSVERSWIVAYLPHVEQWAERHHYPRLRDDDGYLVSHRGRDSWRALADHILTRNPSTGAYILARVIRAIRRRDSKFVEPIWVSAVLDKKTDSRKRRKQGESRR